MKSGADDVPAFIAHTVRPYAPYYNSSIVDSASSSSVSLWSDASSQSSDDTSLSSQSSDSESGDSISASAGKHSALPGIDSCNLLRRPQRTSSGDAAVPVGLRQNSRRTAAGSRSKPNGTPSLVRQSDRKVNFVDNLVDSSTQIVEAIWPLSSVMCRGDLGSKTVLPLRTFIQETLRRSRTSYSTLQVALYYLVLIKPHVPKHNFTMEQPDDRHADRALQCGRRMFLAALILASKYLQDRNYSARAWSKISGLNTQEINQNEVAFLLAVDWKLHITDGVFQRWTEIVLKYTPPPSPPSPGGVSTVLAQQVFDWKQLILKLNPDLTNIEGLISSSFSGKTTSDLCVASPRSILNAPREPLLIPTSSPNHTSGVPTSFEPAPTTSYVAGKPAPALGLLPTPRLTPQLSGICTPAASATPQTLGRWTSMGSAMSQANSLSASQYLDSLPAITSSPHSYFTARRSSLANSVSTASSPESMISDTSRSSRSSSFSSVSSLASATLNANLSVQSRFRGSKQCSGRLSSKPSVPSVPEDIVECRLTSSPDSDTGSVGKTSDLAWETTLGRRETELDDRSYDADTSAARVLQELHWRSGTSMARAGIKRSWSSSLNSLQDNVRDILNVEYQDTGFSWPDTLVRSGDDTYSRAPVRPSMLGSGKRMCCSSEAALAYQQDPGYTGGWERVPY